MIALTNNKSMPEQLEFILGEKIPEKIANELGSMSHLTYGNEWVMKALKEMNKTVNDIKYKEDRELLRKEFKDNDSYKNII